MGFLPEGGERRSISCLPAPPEKELLGLIVGEAVPFSCFCFLVGEGPGRPSERGSGDSLGAMAVLARVRAMLGVVSVVTDSAVGAGVCARARVSSTKASK